mgnify:CR=1 FL=1
MDQILEGPRTVFTLFRLAVTESVINTWIAMAVLIGLALVLRRKMELYPGKVQNAIEFLVDGFQSFVTSTMGEKLKGFMPYMATLFILIASMNLMGVFGFRPPTADLNVTAAFAIITFVGIHFYGIRANGWGHITGLAQPFILFLPMNIIGELAKPVSLSMRLFGNLIGGSVIMAMISGAVALFVPAIASIYFDLFSGLLQSFIFTMLTMVFISLAAE